MGRFQWISLFSDLKWNDSSAELKPFLSLYVRLSGKMHIHLDAAFLLNTFYSPENGNIGIQNQDIPT